MYKSIPKGFMALKIMRKLKLKRQITTSKAATAASKPVPFEYGGLGGKNLELSIKALNTIKSTDLGVNIPVHKTSDLIDMNDLELKDVLTPIVSGPSMVYHNTLHNYTIDNYDSFIDYEITANCGIIANINKNRFDFMGPATNYQEDYVYITINGFINTIKLAKSYIETPTIVGLSNGDNIEVGTNLSFGDYIIRNGYAEYDQHASTDIQICKDKVFGANTVINLLNNVSYKRSYIIPKTLKDGEYYIRIRYHSTKGMDSLWSTPIRITLFHQYIEKPTIVSPESGTYQPVNVTFKGSAPSIKNSSHGFLKSEWQISTDTSFLNPIKTITSSNNSYTITTTLEGNKTYYIRTRYLSDHEDLENSSWSNHISINTVVETSDASGRKFIRHSSGMGTVMTWVDKQGATHNTLVLDAPYRKNLPWANPSNYSFHVNGLTAYTNGWYYYYSVTTSPHKVTDWSATNINDYIGSYITDEEHNKYSAYFEDVGTSRQNTDNMMAYAQCSSTEYAAGWCRAQRVNGIACDLPNIQTLTRIWCSIFILDELDPTPDGNRYLFTGKRSTNSYNWYFNNSVDYAWASTEYNGSTAWIVGYSNGCPYYITKNYSYAVIPILEV